MGVVSRWEQHQVWLYLAAIGAGAALGLSTPAAPVLEHAITPLLMLLLFATFLGVPFAEIGRGFRDIRFLSTVLVANFVVAPLVVWGLSRFVADDAGLLIGVLLVLLTPCIDYVIVFTGLAGGARAKLLAATPMLMLLQIVLLPLYLWLFVGSETLAVVDARPFIEAFVLLIVVPLGAAALVQLVARRHTVGQRIEACFAAAMVPLMMLTLFVVVGSQIAAVRAQLGSLLRLVPLYVAFIVLAVLIGALVARGARLDASESRAMIFSTTTRNSLVVLPLAIALPANLAIAPLAVVTQTLVELVALTVLVRLVPRLTPPASPKLHG